MKEAIMAKVKINSKIKNISTNEEVILECSGIINNHKMIYKDHDSMNEITILENEIILLKKRNDNINMKFQFKKNIDTFVEILSSDYSLQIPLSTTNLTIKENEIEINYQIDSNEKFLFHITYECR